MNAMLTNTSKTASDLSFSVSSFMSDPCQFTGTQRCALMLRPLRLARVPCVRAINMRGAENIQDCLMPLASPGLQTDSTGITSNPHNAHLQSKRFEHRIQRFQRLIAFAMLDVH